eukprot:48263-Eustigmatos_ZCMA.PRE.1
MFLCPPPSSRMYIPFVLSVPHEVSFVSFTLARQRFTLVSSGGGMTNARPAPFTPAPEDEVAKGRGAVGKPIAHKSAMAQ